MPDGQRDLSLEAVDRDRVPQIALDAARLGLLAIMLTGKNHEIGVLAKDRRARVEIEEGGKVLLLDGPGHRKDHRAFRVAQKAVDQAAAPRGPASVRLDSRHHAMDVRSPRAGIERDLALGLIARRSDHRIRTGDCRGLARDAFLESGAVRRIPLVDGERMRGVDQRYLPSVAGAECDLERIGEMGVNHVGPGRGGKIAFERLGDERQPVHQRFLGEVIRATIVQAHDVEVRADALPRRGVDVAVMRPEPPGHYLDGNAGQQTLGLRGAKDITDVTSRILGHSVGDGRGLQEPAKGDVEDPHGRSDVHVIVEERGGLSPRFPPSD